MEYEILDEGVTNVHPFSFGITGHFFCSSKGNEPKKVDGIMCDDWYLEMPEASKSNIHGYIHGKWLSELTTPEVLKNIR